MREEALRDAGSVDRVKLEPFDAWIVISFTASSASRRVRWSSGRVHVGDERHLVEEGLELRGRRTSAAIVASSPRLRQRTFEPPAPLRRRTSASYPLSRISSRKSDASEPTAPPASAARPPPPSSGPSRAA